MPRAFDRRIPADDHNPLANLLDFNNWGAAIDGTAVLAGNQIRGSIIGIIAELTGIDLSVLGPLFDEMALDFSSPTAFLTSLVHALEVLPEVLVALIQILITELASGEMDDSLTELVTALIQLLLSLPSLLLQLGTSLLESGAGILGSNSPLNLLNAFNLLPTNLLGQVGHSLIGTANPNLIADGDFMDSEGFSGLEEWFQIPGGGFAGLGAAQTTADGTSKELLGNLIPVSEGQVMPISGKAKWTDLVGTGNPIQLAVTGYLPGGATDQQIIASHNTTPPTTDWISLSGSYTVPPNVDSVRTRLVVGPTATAGDVFFSDMSATKTQPIWQRLIAGTDPGDTLTTDISNLFGGIMTNAMTLLTKASQSDMSDLFAVLGGDVPSIDDRLNSFLDSLSPLNANNINEGAISDGHVPGLTSINDNIVTRLLRISGSGFGHTEASDALEHTTFAAVDTSSRLAQVELLVTGGVSDSDDLERTSSTSIGTGWLHYKTGSGTWATPNGHDASWAKSGSGDADFLEIRNTGLIRTPHDTQRLVMVMGSKAEKDLFGNCGGNSLWLRISDDTTSLANVTGIRVYYDAVGGATIDRFVAGTRTVLASLAAGTLTAPGPGSSVWAEAPSTARYFRSGIGTSTLISVTEVGIASGLGAAYRRWGHGGHAEGLVFTQAGPGSIHQITCKDLG